MGDLSVEYLLKQWGVPQLAERFKEQEIDLSSLNDLPEDVIAELVPLIGPRSKFLKGWKKWLEDGAPCPSPTTSPGASGAGADFPDFAEVPDYGGGMGVGMGCEAASNASVSVATLERERKVLMGGSTASSMSMPQPPRVHPAAPPAPAANVASPAQAGSSGLAPVNGKTKEVNIILEGKISYENDSMGWMTATGHIVPPGGDNWGDNVVIKTEPGEEMPPSQKRGPKFQLQGSILLSEQSFMEIPQFMLSENPVCYDEHADPQPASPADLLQMQMQVPSGPAAEMNMPSIPVAKPAPASGRKRARVENWDLETLLNSSSKGKMVLSLYRQKNCLDGPSRQTLTDLIIAEELREDLNRRITSQRFQEIAESIVELFPNENEDTYFSNDRSYNERPGGKGKLTSKYYNTRRQLAKSGVISRAPNKERRKDAPPATFTALTYAPGQEKEAQRSMEWVQSLGSRVDLSAAELQAAQSRWRDCWKTRMLRLLGQWQQPLAYLNDFPILRTPFGSTLIKDDFSLLYKNVSDRLVNLWPEHGKHVIGLLSDDYRKHLVLLDHVRRDLTTVKGKEVGAFLLLPLMLPVTTCKGVAENSELWRPTRQEAMDGFVLHVQNQADVADSLANYWARMKSMGQPVCPLPVIVGQTLDKIEASMVCIDENTCYYTSDPLTAVDLCFKSFHALQAPYPPQAHNCWLFLQHAVYQIATPGDRVSVSVSSLLADFGLRPVPPVGSWDQLL